MRICQYTSDQFDVLKRAASGLGKESALLHKPFVDYYYASRPTCQLWLALSDSGELEGTVGVERMRFETPAGELVLGFGSNFHALQPGVGGHLYLRWMKLFKGGIIFGSSEDAQKIYRSQGWTFFPNVPEYELNRAYPSYETDPLWRRAAKAVVGRVRRRPLGRFERRLAGAAATVDVEETSFSEELVPAKSPFSFRYAPTADDVRWRYAPNLSFVRYRLFRVRSRSATVGYVILNDLPDQIIVAHCDGDDAERLAHGILLAVLRVGAFDRGPRSVLLATTHPTMRAVFEAFGFQRTYERPIAVGGAKGKPEIPASPAGWLVSFDWGDNGLRSPFLDQKA